MGLRPIATVGGAGSAVELNQLIEYTVDADTLGHIFVLDAWFGQQVQLIDTAGTLIRVLTRQGGGPGEIGNGISISAKGDGDLMVVVLSDSTTNEPKLGIFRSRDHR